MSAFNILEKKILYEENPDALPKDEYEAIHKEVAARVLSTNKEKWNTIPKNFIRRLIL